MNKRHFFHGFFELLQIAAAILSIASSPMLDLVSRPGAKDWLTVTHMAIYHAPWLGWFALATLFGATIAKQAFGNTPQNHRRDQEKKPEKFPA